MKRKDGKRKKYLGEKDNCGGCERGRERERELPEEQGEKAEELSKSGW